MANNLIDTSYFINEIAVAQIDYEPVASVVTGLIDKYEPFYLSVMLGNQLHQDFKAGLAAPVIEQRWLDLRDGIEFTDSAGNPWHWRGFTNSEKVSPIAYYIFFYWLRKENQTTTGAGEGRLQGENITRVGPIAKQVHIWNQMTALNYSLLKYLLYDPASYGDVRCTYVKENLLTPINEFNL